MEKYCVRCGKKFEAMGREVICPACRESAQEDAKRAAVLRAKQASWRGESVPVRISGRASTVIRRYGAAHNVPFAAALDDLLKASAFFKSTGKAWTEITPYKSRRMKKSAQDAPQDAPQDKQDTQEQTRKQDAPQAGKAVKTAGKAASKVTSKATKK